MFARTCKIRRISRIHGSALSRNPFLGRLYSAISIQRPCSSTCLGAGRRVRGPSPAQATGRAMRQWRSLADICARPRNLSLPLIDRGLVSFTRAKAIGIASRLTPRARSARLRPRKRQLMIRRSLSTVTKRARLDGEGERFTLQGRGHAALGESARGGHHAERGFSREYWRNCTQLQSEQATLSSPYPARSK